MFAASSGSARSVCGGAKRETVVMLAPKLSPPFVRMEACCGGHHLGRLFAAHAHEMRLMSPVFGLCPSKKNDDRDQSGAAYVAERDTPLGRWAKALLKPLRFLRVKKDTVPIISGGAARKLQPSKIAWYTQPISVEYKLHYINALAIKWGLRVDNMTKRRIPHASLYHLRTSLFTPYQLCANG